MPNRRVQHRSAVEIHPPSKPTSCNASVLVRVFNEVVSDKQNWIRARIHALEFEFRHLGAQLQEAMREVVEGFGKSFDFWWFCSTRIKGPLSALYVVSLSIEHVSADAPRTRRAEFSAEPAEDANKGTLEAVKVWAGEVKRPLTRREALAVADASGHPTTAKDPMKVMYATLKSARRDFRRNGGRWELVPRTDEGGTAT